MVNSQEGFSLVEKSLKRVVACCCLVLGRPCVGDLEESCKKTEEKKATPFRKGKRVNFHAVIQEERKFKTAI
jgi:hypothetical protein